MNSIIKKISLTLLATTLLATTFNFKKTNASTSTPEITATEKFNLLSQEITDINSELYNTKGKSLNATEVLEAEITALKDEMYNLVLENPEEFEGYIISDEEKREGLNIQNSNTRELPKWDNYGDIFVRKTSSYTWSLTGHAGIGDYDRYYTIEAYPDTGVTFHYDYDKWKNEPTAGIYRPYNVTTANYRSATDYSIRQLGSPYNKSFKADGEGYYCSELVFFAWKYATGLRLRTTSYADDYILPSELANSPQTYAINWPY